MTTGEWTGKCACGALSWRATAAPTLQGFCHCKSCQRTSGGGHVGFLCFAEATITVTGERRVYTRPGGSGRPASRFACPTCLAVVYGTAEIMPGVVNIYAGSLDDSARFKPTMAVFVRERPPWDNVSRNLTCFETVPGG